MKLARSVSVRWPRGTGRQSLSGTLLSLALSLAWMIAIHPAWILAQNASPANIDWPSYGNDPGMMRYQNVDQINPTNVEKLKVAWVFHTGVLEQYAAFQVSPVVVNGTMYVTDGHDDVFALNAATGAQKWAYKPLSTGDLPPLETLPICCGHNNRGVAVGNGMVYYGRLDNAVIGLNQSTGAVVWKTFVASSADGYSITPAPQYYSTKAHPNGLVFISVTGGEFLARGQVFALDANTGSIVWRTYTTVGPAGWGGDAYLRCGAMLWNVAAIDPNLNEVVFSTGNPTRDVSGQERPGTNPYTDSIIALDLDTGAVKWTFQEVHHDIWDYDAA